MAAREEAGQPSPLGEVLEQLIFSPPPTRGEARALHGGVTVATLNGTGARGSAESSVPAEPARSTRRAFI